MSQHAESSPLATTAHPLTAAHSGEHAEPSWQSGAHNLQRTVENVYAPIELAHHLRHHASLGGLSGLAAESSALSPLGGAMTAESALAAPALPEYGHLVQSLRQTPTAPARALPAGSLRGLGPILGGLSGLFGALELAHGVHEIQEPKGDKLQGTLDILAGLGGIGSGGLALVGSGLAGVTALPAACLGMVAYGNKKSQEWNVHGAAPGQERRSNFGMVGQFAQDAYTGVHTSLGRGIAGKIGGVAAAGLVGLATGSVATAANLVMGTIGAGLDAGRFIGSVAEALWHHDTQAGTEPVVA